MPEAILTTENLSYVYGDGTKALEDISLSVVAGQRVGLIGPNGSGKSTLLMCLSGLFAAEGKIRCEDLEVTKSNLKALRQRVGLVFQNPDDQLFMPTVAEDLMFGPVNLGWDDDRVKSAVRDMASKFNLSQMLDRPPHHLSMGQKRNAAIACVLVMSPAVLLMDEPSSNLDPRSRRRLIEVLQGVDATCLIASHDLALVGRLCDRVVLIDNGQIAASGPTAELLANKDLMENHGLEQWHDGEPAVH